MELKRHYLTGGIMSSRFDRTAKVKLGHYFRSCRIKVKLSQEDVAKKLGFKSAQFISNVERGIAFFSIAQLIQIIDIYQLNEDFVEAMVINELKASFFRDWAKLEIKKTDKVEELHFPLRSSIFPIS